MKASIRSFVFGVAVLLASGPAVAAGGGDTAMEPSGVNVHDIASVQRGAKWFVNNCHGCHSLDYMRYNRLAEDLGLSEEMVVENLMFADKKIGETMSIAMTKEAGERWFGKAPPDLSVVGRSRGTEWLYNFLIGYYEDANGNWNNTMLANAAMPHPLWQLQGIQTPIYEENEAGYRTVTGLELATPGTQDEEEYRQTARDIVAFLAYVGEPAVLQRKQVGVWVMLFLALFAFLAFMLKREFWRDVH